MAAAPWVLWPIQVGRKTIFSNMGYSWPDKVGIKFISPTWGATGSTNFMHLFELGLKTNESDTRCRDDPTLGRYM
eukprot:CAMPEP_0204218320 /NCGR_PEP_ID=MMETSP0361-20130328/79521_1 /ASSEMBLY_ACC=CAM_ASM_000343 /TAXON_ID=268821 /ORGANISM="Scrippsiella Hangoei, Strain SHTV-5" /LENGTH=74 /DNA_ID=CAMNT_0051183451 /DNA_START=10 /DNA_END=234 /DNA_ORIENTATION=+